MTNRTTTPPHVSAAMDRLQGAYDEMVPVAAPTPVGVDDLEWLRDMLAKATPGPWYAEGPTSSTIVWSDTDHRVCFLTSDGPARENAALIAAAPDLAAKVIEQADRIAALEAQVGALPEAHDEQLAIWADELISDLILSGLMELSGHDYGTKVGAHRAIVAALKSANEAATPTPEPAPADPVAEAVQP